MLDKCEPGAFGEICLISVLSISQKPVEGRSKNYFKNMLRGKQSGCRLLRSWRITFLTTCVGSRALKRIGWLNPSRQSSYERSEIMKMAIFEVCGIKSDNMLNFDHSRGRHREHSSEFVHFYLFPEKSEIIFRIFSSFHLVCPRFKTKKARLEDVKKV